MLGFLFFLNVLSQLVLFLLYYPLCLQGHGVAISWNAEVMKIRGEKLGFCKFKAV